ncbi:efflux RND transporter permease subunit [Calditrichota bacterium LG25]
MERLAESVVKYRIPIIISVAFLTIFFGYQLKNLKVNSDLFSYLREDDPDVQLFNRIGKEYAGTSIAMVGIGADDVFTHKTLNVINRITEKIKQIDGVATVMSLTDVLDIRSFEGSLEVGRLIDKNNIPDDPQKLRQIRSYTLSKDMYNGRIVSPDGKVTIIIARLKQNADKQEVALKIQEIAQKEAGGYQLYFSGLPMQMLEVNDIIISDMLYLVPLVALVLVLMLYFSFRTKRGVILPLLTVIISTIWAMGLMSLLGVELSIISNIMPVLLIAIGSAYGIHMIARYKEDIKGAADTISGIKHSLSTVGVPIILAGMTTVVGFFSFAGSYLTAVNDFGIFTGIGVIFALVISITFLPAFLTFLKKPEMKSINKEGKNENALDRFLDRLAFFVLKNEKLIIILGGLLVIISIIGLPRIKREVNMIEYFKEDTDIRIAEVMMEKKFGGSTPVQILVKGDLKNPFVLKEMRKFEKFLESVPYVSKPQSIADLICEMNKVMNNHYTIPDTREGVANLWFFIEGESILEQLVNNEGNEGIIQANLATMATGKILKSVTMINEYIKNEMDTSLVAVKINQDNAQEIINLKIPEITQLILSDFTRHQIEIKVDRAQLRRLIREIYLTKRVQFDDRTLNDISEKVVDFFLNESEIEIDNEALIRQITNQILDLVKSGNPVNEAAIKKTLTRQLASRGNYDADELADTAYSLFVILDEYWQYQRIMDGVDLIIARFAPQAKNNAKLRDALRDDLWVLNEKMIALPSTVASSKGLEGERVSVQFVQSGMPLIFTKLDDSLMKSQIQSLFIALVLVSIILIIQLNSVTGGLISITPIILTVLLNFALMAYLNIPLDNATMMIASIAIGIGIDYSIHFTHRFKEEFSRSNDPLKALEATMLTTGRAILTNALAVGAGFIILIFAQLIPIQRFGWLTATTMLFSSIGAVTFLPALILFTRARFVGNFRNFSFPDKIVGKKRGR